MVEAFSEKVPWRIYILNIFYWLLPAAFLYLGLAIGFPVEMTLFIHIVIEFVIPKIIIAQFKDSNLFRVEWRINRFDGSAILGIILGIFFWCLCIFTYWLIDKVIGWDIEDNLMATPIPQNRFLEIITAFYLICVKPYIEEWFWRSYSHYIFYRSEIDNWLNSILWSTAYVILAYMWNLEKRGWLAVAIFSTIFGRIQIAIVGKYGGLAAYMTNLGASFGIMLCYFLEKNKNLG